MNSLLLRSCAWLWILGLLGMWFARAVLVLEPHALLFKIAASLWILGGLGYTGIGLSTLVAGEYEAESRREASPADLSALIRRR